MRLRIGAVLAGCAIAFPAVAQPDKPAVPHSPGRPYAARNLADRIVLSTGADAAIEMAVAFRTDTDQPMAEAEIAPAIDGPSLAVKARPVQGTSIPISTENGRAIYHQVRFSGLTPDTPYVYRVRGSAGWSEWLQFRTAARDPRPFRFLYFGDTQNGILPIASRVIRQAFHATATPALVVHAGDLVAQRDDLVHDDEWGEWTQAGGYNFSIVPQLPATGNHEYVDAVAADGGETRHLGPHWTAGFALPGNGSPAAAATTYHVDYQGVRFIVMDGTSAIDFGTARAQADWLDKALSTSKANWNVVIFHQPIFTCARPDDTAELKSAWKPVFDRHDVDLVLQGHDHCYSRLTAEDGRDAGRTRRAQGRAQGPVYLVSVTGQKMYALNDRARSQPDRVAEDTELYQVVDVEPHRLKFRTYTTSGGLYDGFDLVRRADGGKTLTDIEGIGPARTCAGGTGPDGGACSARGK
ncbi:purple acid phosphatase family protein [Sphingomonas colocasiae]|uniref:Metallophosphoesterase family protein n=1 Tax=Sphingomonas colocasiae TaxID=1848973 RepID=A0ABS7PN86_9SPHN|nr:metallophosphoesterase family protein [Sphingomonas colocasiae]MBY8821504.1 metallophosphoesterase family protein [Sphingomonas colocasiae]